MAMPTVLEKILEKDLMKYAMPVSNSRLMSHFGQADEFMLLDVGQDGVVAKKETIKVTPHSCGALPGELAQRGVGVVLAGGMGMGPRMAFQQSNIEVVLGVTELDPEKAVVAHANHTLENGVNICDHGDTICDHNH
jgi:predicted Fe-Mo cluster-binding NifX family protein